MAPRTGRPKKENAITKHLAVRIDQETEDILIKYCEENNITKGEAIRIAIHFLAGHKK